jgi:hypothetical protein
MFFTALLGNGFHRRTFPFLWVPEMSSASTTSFLVLCDCLHTLTSLTDYLMSGRSVKLMLAKASTVISGFSLLEIHGQDFYSLLDIHVFRNGASSSTNKMWIPTDILIRLVAVVSLFIRKLKKSFSIRHLYVVAIFTSRKITKTSLQNFSDSFMSFPHPTPGRGNPANSGLMNLTESSSPKWS